MAGNPLPEDLVTKKHSPKGEVNIPFKICQYTLRGTYQGVYHHRHVGVMNARFLRTPNARSILQRCKLFAWDLQSALEATRVQC